MLYLCIPTSVYYIYITRAHNIQWNIKSTRFKDFPVNYDNCWNAMFHVSCFGPNSRKKPPKTTPNLCLYSKMYRFLHIWMIIDHISLCIISCHIVKLAPRNWSFNAFVIMSKRNQTLAYLVFLHASQLSKVMFNCLSG